MELIVYKNIPCPVLSMKEPDTFLVLFKGEQKWLYKCSLGYGEIEKNKNAIFYYFNDKTHRENGPAVEWHDGDKSWYQNGLLHREDGPAIEYINSKEWYKNGELHRENGPAVEYSDGSKEYWINGKEYKQNEFNNR